MEPFLTMHVLTDTDIEKIYSYTEKILASPFFSGSPRQQRFLQYLVANTIENNADRLKGYTIGIDVFDRGQDLDPSVDSIVRVEATRIRNKLREYYDKAGGDDEIRINFRKGCYHLDFSLNNLVSVISPTALDSQTYNSKPSIVVLPFVSISPDASQDYFADGMTDSLISLLARISGLFVISRQSSFAYKDTMKTSKEIANELGVKYLLEGSIQHAGDKIRVAVHLINADDETHIWSERYERTLADIFALQDELTQHITNALQVQLTTEDDKIFGYKATNNIDAYDSLLKAISIYLHYSQQNTKDAIELFKHVITLDPSYSAAHSWLARALAFQWSMYWDRSTGILAAAQYHAEYANKLAPQTSFALSMLGWVHLWRKNAEESIYYCQKAVDIDPNNAEALLFLSLAYSSAGFGNEALEYINRAKLFTPTSATLYEYALGNCYFVLEDYKTAIETYERGIRMSATFIPNYHSQLYAFAHLGMSEQAQKNLERLKTLTTNSKDLISISIWTSQEILARNERVRHQVFDAI